MSANDGWAARASASTAEQRLSAAQRVGNLPAILSGLTEVHGPIPGITELSVVGGQRPASADGAETAEATPPASPREARIQQFRGMTKAQRDELFDELMTAEYDDSPPEAA